MYILILLNTISISFIIAILFKHLYKIHAISSKILQIEKKLENRQFTQNNVFD